MKMLDRAESQCLLVVEEEEEEVGVEGAEATTTRPQEKKTERPRLLLAREGLVENGRWCFPERRVFLRCPIVVAVADLL